MCSSSSPLYFLPPFPPSRDGETNYFPIFMNNEGRCCVLNRPFWCLAQTKKGFNALLADFTDCMFVVGPFKRTAVIFIRSKTKYN